MTGRLHSIFIGALASMVVAIPVLILQHRRLNATGPSVSANLSVPAVPPARAVNAFAAAWHRLMSEGGADAELRAATAANMLDAAGCAAAASWAVSDETGTKMLQAIICRWAALDPESAMQWVMRHKDVEDFGVYFGEAAGGWAAKNPAGLESWQAGQPGDQKLTAGSIEALLPVDAAAAIRVALNSQQEIELKVLARGVRDSSSAERVMSQLWQARGTPVARDLFRNCRRLWMQIDAVACLEWEIDHPGIPEIKTGIPGYRVETILGSSNTPETATAILSSTPADQRSETLSLLIGQWAVVDPDSAGAWLDRQPATPDRWAAAAEYAVVCASIDSRAAFTWTGTIGDDSLRHRAERKVLLKWYETDPEAAMSWLNSGSWTPEIRLEMQERMAAIPSPGRKVGSE